MKILIVTQYYWPEFFLINRLSQKLVLLGNEVTVATGKPNYPEGKLYDGYKSSGIIKEWFGGVEVIRVPHRPRGKGAVNLVINYLSFIFSGIYYFPKLLKGRSYDVIFSFVPSPITSTIPAIWFNKKLKSHLVIWVQDLWPQSIEATGYVKNKKLLFLVGMLVRWIYSKCDTILAQSHAFEAEIGKYASKEKIFYYPNSIEKQSVLNDVVLPKNILKYFKDGFNLVFTGNIGTAQSIPTLLKVADKLRDTDCRFIFIGNGSLEGWAKDESKKLKLSNVEFPGWVDNNMMPLIYEHADALLVSLTEQEIFTYTIPGKLQAYLAAGKPIVASINGEAAEIVRKAKAGIVCAAENVDELENGIRCFRLLSQSKRDDMGASGLKYFNNNFDMNIMSQRLLNLLNDRIEVCKK